MNEKNKKILWLLIQKKGDDLIGKLPQHVCHPKGRNPYAHICTLIKSEFKSSYKFISDFQFDDVKNFIDNIDETY